MLGSYMKGEIELFMQSDEYKKIHEQEEKEGKWDSGTMLIAFATLVSDTFPALIKSIISIPGISIIFDNSPTIGMPAISNCLIMFSLTGIISFPLYSILASDNRLKNISDLPTCRALIAMQTRSQNHHSGRVMFGMLAWRFRLFRLWNWNKWHGSLLFLS